MSIQVECPCSCQFSVVQECVGQHVRCPNCNQTIVVPLANAPSLTPAVTFGVPKQSVGGDELSARSTGSFGYIVLAILASLVLIGTVIGMGIWSYLRHQVEAEPAISADGKLQPSIVLPKPPPAAKMRSGKDLSALDPALLAAEALDLAEAGDSRNAIQLQYWAVAQGYVGKYNLACFYSRDGKIDEALYWLQEAAIDEGVDAEWAELDPDLIPLRKDVRWNATRKFLKRANEFWAQKDPAVHHLILPQGYTGKRPLRIVVTLHGMGHNAKGFLSRDFQLLADQWNFAFVGVCGAVARGKSSFVWSEDHQANNDRVQKALKQFSSKLSGAQGKVILLGFSQGAQAAAEVAARNPQLYAGAIIFSPGGLSFSLQGFQPAPSLKDRGFVLMVGELEPRGNYLLTAKYANWFRRQDARVNHRALKGVARHALPPNFNKRLPGWVSFIHAKSG